MTRTPWLALTLALALALVLAAGTAFARAGKSARVMYTGKLQNENMGKIAGVYPIQFSLYKTRKGRRAIWSESLWVAVENGNYSVEIGARKKLPRSLNLERLFLGVEIVGIGEILRERLIPETRAAPQPAMNTISAPAPASKTDPLGAASGASVVDEAMFAYEAGYSKNSAKLNNMDVEELKKFIHVPVKLGLTTKNTSPAGGAGGYEFTESCPKGYVVTGMRGAAGKYLDSLTLICSPLE